MSQVRRKGKDAPNLGRRGLVQRQTAADLVGDGLPG